MDGHFTMLMIKFKLSCSLTLQFDSQHPPVLTSQVIAFDSYRFCYSLILHKFFCLSCTILQCFSEFTTFNLLILILFQQHDSLRKFKRSWVFFLTDKMAPPAPVTSVIGNKGCTIGTKQFGSLGLSGFPETRNHLKGGEGKLLPANELESLRMESEGEINYCGACLCPYESPLPNDLLNVLIKRYGAGGS